MDKKVVRLRSMASVECFPVGRRQMVRELRIAMINLLDSERRGGTLKREKL